MTPHVVVIPSRLDCGSLDIDTTIICVGCTGDPSTVAVIAGEEPGSADSSLVLREVSFPLIVSTIPREGLPCVMKSQRSDIAGRGLR